MSPADVLAVAAFTRLAHGRGPVVLTGGPAKRSASSSRVLLGTLTTLSVVNYLDRYVMAATQPADPHRAGDLRQPGGLLQSSVHRDLLAGVPDRGLAG
jgi:hypothetical protein